MNSTQGVGERARERVLAGIAVGERRLPLAGVSTAVLEGGGDGPPMVLLHGPGEFAATWLPVLPDLVRAHRVIAPDLPGHGATAAPDGPLDAERVLVQAAMGGLIGQFGAAPIPPAELARIEVATTLIWGRYDLATPLHIAEAAADRYGWPLHVIDGAGDDPPLDQPDAFLAALRAAIGTPTWKAAA